MKIFTVNSYFQFEWVLKKKNTIIIVVITIISFMCVCVLVLNMNRDIWNWYYTLHSHLVSEYFIVTKLRLQWVVAYSVDWCKEGYLSRKNINQPSIGTEPWTVKDKVFFTGCVRAPLTSRNRGSLVSQHSATTTTLVTLKYSDI